MVNLAENPSLIICDCVVLDGLMSHLFSQSIDDLNFVEVQDNTAACTTWDVSDLIGLQSYLDREVSGDKGNHEVKSWFCP